MDPVQSRLARCFEKVFPDVPAASVPNASQATVATWDSVATVTLLNVIEDEFGFQIDIELLPELDSFERILSHVKTQIRS
jgi:acyl carrier protein